MPQTDLFLLRRKELVGTIAWLAWILTPFLMIDGLQIVSFLTAWISTAAWVSLDEHSRRQGFSVWSLLTIFLGPAGFAAYYLTRKPVTSICSRCGSVKNSSNQPCPTCGHMTPLGHAISSIQEVYIGLAESLVKSPAGKAKETAKHLSIALAAMVIVSGILRLLGELDPIGALLDLIFALSMAGYWVLLAWWVYLDARWRRSDGIPWAVLTLVTNVVGLVTYLVIRYPDPKTCSHCGESIPTNLKYCPFCGSEAEATCPHCQSAIQPNWQFCPTCAARLAPALSRAETIDPQGITISGVVVDAKEGIPIPNALVEIDSRENKVSSITDSQGKFTLTSLKMRPYIILTSAENYTPRPTPISPTADGIRNLCITLDNEYIRVSK